LSFVFSVCSDGFSIQYLLLEYYGSFRSDFSVVLQFDKRMLGREDENYLSKIVTIAVIIRVGYHLTVLEISQILL